MFKIGVVEFDCGHDSGGATYGTQTVYRVEINPGSLAEANAMRWQMLGQRDQVVAVVWDDDPIVNGMYIQRDCSVSPIANYLAHGRMSVNVVLERVVPLIEANYQMTYFVSAEPTNFIVSAVHGMYDPSDTSSGAAVWDDLNWEFDQYLDIVDADGTPAYLPIAVDTFTVGAKNLHVQQSVDPKLLDLGRAQLEVNLGDDAGWWILEGKRVPEGADIRLSSGLVRLTVVAGDDYMSLEQWDATTLAWAGMARYTIVYAGGTTPYFRPHYEIFKSDRGEVLLRCTMSDSTSTTSIKYAVDLTVRRGVPLVRVVPNRAINADEEYGSIALEMSEYDGTDMATQTFDTTSLRRTSAVSSGVRPYLFAARWVTGVTSPTPVASTVDDSVEFTSVSFAIFNVGGIDGRDYYEAKYLLTDRLVR